MDNEIFFRTKLFHWNMTELIKSIQDQPFTKRILALHTISRCNTTSRLFGKGKPKFFTVDRENERYWSAVDLCYIVDVSKQDIAEVGEQILLTVYRNTYEADTSSLNELRLVRYKDKPAKSATLIKAESLPPTCNAANLHALRSYLKVQLWVGNDIRHLEYGFI